jgi:hypothetical protein
MTHSRAGFDEPPGSIRDEVPVELTARIPGGG